MYVEGYLYLALGDKYRLSELEAEASSSGVGLAQRRAILILDVGVYRVD